MAASVRCAAVTRPTAIALVVAALAVVGACDGGPTEPAGPTATATVCDPPRSARPGRTSGTVASQGATRTYVQHVPIHYDGRRPVPLLLNLHGYGSSANAQMDATQFPELADAETFVVVAPDGQLFPMRFNALGVAPGEQDDAVMVADLLEHVTAELCIDDRRIYVVGVSIGAVMALDLACRGAPRFAAFGAVAALSWTDECDRAGPAPVIGVVGTADRIVPFEGGAIRCCGAAVLPPAVDTMANWARHDGCRPEPVETEPVPRVRRLRYQGCTAGAAVEFYVIEGGAHAWPGAELDGRELSPDEPELETTRLLWAFFRRHARAGPPRIAAG
jgi:polyhydroxybutyrate depolymerase